MRCCMVPSACNSHTLPAPCMRACIPSCRRPSSLLDLPEDTTQGNTLQLGSTTIHSLHHHNEDQQLGSKRQPVSQKEGRQEAQAQGQLAPQLAEQAAAGGIRPNAGGQGSFSPPHAFNSIAYDKRSGRWTGQVFFGGQRSSELPPSLASYKCLSTKIQDTAAAAAKAVDR